MTRSSALVVLVGLSLVGCTKYVPQSVPLVTCMWLDQVQAEGLEVSNDSGVVLDDVFAAFDGLVLDGHDVVHDRPATVSLELLGNPREGAHVVRRFPPNREVFSSVSDVGCLEGDLVRATSQVRLTVDVQDVGVAELFTAIALEGRGLSDGDLAWDGRVAPDLAEVDAGWRDLVREARPDGPALTPRTLRVGIAGTLASGAVETQLAAKDLYGITGEFVRASRIEW